MSHLSSEIIAPDQYLEAKSTEMSRNSSEKTEATKMNTDDNQDNVNESLGQEVEGLKRNTLDLPDTGLLERSGGSASSVFSGAGMSKDEKRKKQKHVGKEGRSKLVSDYKELINKHQSLTEVSFVNRNLHLIQES